MGTRPPCRHRCSSARATCMLACVCQPQRTCSWCGFQYILSYLCTAAARLCYDMKEGSRVSPMQLDSSWDAIAKLPAASPGARAQTTNMCYIIFTSGSTGRPKGAVMQHDGVLNNLHSLARCGRAVSGSWHPAWRAVSLSGHSRHPVCAGVCASPAETCSCSARQYHLMCAPHVFDSERSPLHVIYCGGAGDAHLPLARPAASHTRRLPRRLCKSCLARSRAAARCCWRRRAARRTRSTWRAYAAPSASAASCSCLPPWRS